MTLPNVEECEINECAGCAWCDAVKADLLSWGEATCDSIQVVYAAAAAADVATFHATGELPAAWTPEVDAEFDARVDEMNRELEQEREAIESGSVEPPRFGWLNMSRGPKANCSGCHGSGVYRIRGERFSCLCSEAL